MAAKTILLIDDSQDDEELTRRALQENQIPNDIVVARDGVEALEYLLGPGPSRGICPSSRCSISSRRAWTGSRCCGGSAPTRARGSSPWWC